MFPLTCPTCGMPLQFEGGSYRCRKRHTFDQAKSGYVNLLEVTQKRSKQPGDNKLMATARRDFLNKGYYEFLSNAINDTACSLPYKRKTLRILDVGCGEGYYTTRLAEALHSLNKKFELLGIDISKYAVDLAARRWKKAFQLMPDIENAEFAAASAFRLPTESSVCDLALNLFAPFCQEELLRVLSPGGFLIMAIPGKEHLWELKQIIYDTPYQNEVKDYPLEGFHFLKAKKIKLLLTLPTQQDILHLFEMTPYYYKTSKEGLERLDKLEHLAVTASFELLIYQKI